MLIELLIKRAKKRFGGRLSEKLEIAGQRPPTLLISVL
jgi:hypothetical protein